MVTHGWCGAVTGEKRGAVAIAVAIALTFVIIHSVFLNIVGSVFACTVRCLEEASHSIDCAGGVEQAVETSVVQLRMGAGFELGSHGPVTPSVSRLDLASSAAGADV